MKLHSVILAMLLLGAITERAEGAVGTRVLADSTVVAGQMMEVVLPMEQKWVEVRAGAKGSVRRSGGIKAHRGWTLEFCDPEGACIFSATLRPTADSDLYHTPGNSGVMTVTDRAGNRDIPLADIGACSTIALSRTGRNLYELWTGDRELQFVEQFRLDAPPASLRLTGEEGSTDVYVRSVNIAVAPRYAARGTTGHTLASVEAEGKADPAHRRGVYVYLDSDVYTERAQAGGKYMLGIVTDGVGGYDIIYIDGAVKYAGEWQEGMVKGHLAPTQFEDHYNLEWTDSMGDSDFSEAWARFNGQILELHFPVEKAVIRLSRR